MNEPESTGQAGAREQRERLIACIRTIGRGKDGARPLDAERAAQLFDEIFSGRIDELSLGAVLIALRVKGETVNELVGAMQALAAHVREVPVDPSRPTVALPTYNGARKLPNLVPLLACLLADAGVQVIVHGLREADGRTTTWQVMQAMGLASSERIEPIERACDALGRGDPAFVPIDVLAPPLAALLRRRAVLGVRNTGHTLAKLLNPTGSPRCLLLASFTHPEFDELQHAYFLRTGAQALVMRGTEGEVVASARRAARIDWLHDGTSQTMVHAQTLPLGEVPALPAAHDVADTARWIQSVLAGERPVPAPIQAQVECVLRVVRAPGSSDGAAAEGGRPSFAPLASRA